MEEMKKRYETVNEKIWNLDSRMDTRGREQAESSCAIQPKLDTLLKNSLDLDKLVVEKTLETRVDFVEQQRKKKQNQHR